MPRQPREDYVGAWHHLMNRGAARRALFHDDVDSLQFLDCIATAGEKAAVEIHAYCLMSNHFHIGATVLHMVGGATPRTAYASYPAERVDARTSRFYKDLEWD